MNREEVIDHYKENREEIESRLQQFKNLREASDRRLFQELSFVIFSSQSSAENAWNSATEIGEEGLLEYSEERIADILHGNNVQYDGNKASYIVENRENLSQPTLTDPTRSLKLKNKIKPGDLEKTREWLVDNIKGLSWKGGSHFLRNIGYGDSFAILSTHTVSVLGSLNVIKATKLPKNKEQYMEMEEKVQEFSREIEIDIEALDLVLWSVKTGEVFK